MNSKTKKLQQKNKDLKNYITLVDKNIIISSTDLQGNIIEVSEDKNKIEVAVSGFAENDISVMVEHGQLIIEGSKVVEETAVFLHNGISARDFSRSFTLADYVEVQSAEVENGILSVCLERIVPEAMKPKEIKVKQ